MYFIQEDHETIARDKRFGFLKGRWDKMVDTFRANGVTIKGYHPPTRFNTGYFHADGKFYVFDRVSDAGHSWGAMPC